MIASIRCRSQFGKYRGCFSSLRAGRIRVSPRLSPAKNSSVPCPGRPLSVTTAVPGAGLFAGYYNDKNATDARLRNGMFWSGDLAYRDADGWIYFAGRSGDWLRVDGENAKDTLRAKDLLARIMGPQDPF